jgi:hypothetical protein
MRSGPTAGNRLPEGFGKGMISGGREAAGRR